MLIPYTVKPLYDRKLFIMEKFVGPKQFLYREFLLHMFNIYHFL